MTRNQYVTEFNSVAQTRQRREIAHNGRKSAKARHLAYISTLCLKFYTWQFLSAPTEATTTVAEMRRRSLAVRCRRRTRCAKLGYDLPVLRTTQGSPSVSGPRSDDLLCVLRDEAPRRDRLS